MSAQRGIASTSPLAVSIPLDKLELVFHQLVPRFETPIILCDDGSGMAERAADRLIQFGYNRIDILQGGIHAWKEAGYEIFSGINVPSKAFGEFVEQRYSTLIYPQMNSKPKSMPVRNSSSSTVGRCKNLQK